MSPARSLLFRRSSGSRASRHNMADVVSPEVRSRMMSGIRGKDTKPELLIRSSLHRVGFRYRLHPKALPGKPDMLFPRYEAVLFIHGCFWHGHQCNLFRWPQSREDFWREKIQKNVQRDQTQVAQLLERGYRVGTIWECALRGRHKLPLDVVLTRCSDWLKSSDSGLEIHGHQTGASV
jgi:DNA mismatch endonuclease (patch repair protein)